MPMDFRPILFAIGILLVALALTMMLPALVDLITGHPDWIVFTMSASMTLFAGGALILSCRAQFERLTIRQAFVLTTFSWLTVALFGALPFVFAGIGLTLTDAVFEAMSGITTTGSTVIVGLDDLPPGLLLWRALLQWLGGIGIIVTAVAVLPMLQVGGMQLFRTESSDRSEKALPRAAEIAAGIATIYFALTAAIALALHLAGLRPLDAVAHAMTTIATGGFSTRDASVGHFMQADVEWIVTFGMIAGGIPFVLYLQAVRGRPRTLFMDQQVQWYLGILAVGIVVLTTAHSMINEQNPFHVIRFVAFNVVSVMTGTGYSTTDYGAWGSFAVTAFFFVMFIGGCAGSTSCGIKVFRFQILYAGARAQMGRLMQPHGVFVPHYNRRPISPDIVQSVMAFFFLYALSYAVLAIALALLGLDFVTATSGAATAINNVGPGLGPVIGPAGNFAPLPDAAKLLLAAGMLLGRLELFTVLILFSPMFWRG